MNPREQRLLAIFLVIILLTISWLGWGRLKEHESTMRAEAADLRASAQRDQAFLDAYETELTGARHWLDERLGPPLAQQQADIKLFNAVEESAKSVSLTLQTPKFLPPQDRGELRLARYSATVTGSEGYIYPWLAAFHNPDKLQCISGLTIKPDKDDESIIICEVEFGQWYLPEADDDQS